MKIVLDKKNPFNSSNLYNNPRKIYLEEFFLNFNGAFDLPFNGDIFNGYLSCRDSDLLFVFLSPAGREKSKNSGEVVFVFTEFIGSINANMLYIEDPMYKKHKDLYCGWFYGDENVSHIDQVVEIINSIAKKNKIKKNNIVFVGVSAGGYAAILCAAKLEGAKAYAFNPQIKLSEWGYSKKFTEITKIDTNVQDKLLRNDISWFVEKKQSTFFIHFNSFSDVDKPQLKVICDALDVEIRDGLAIKDNVFISIKSMDVNLPHNARFDADDLSIAICIMDSYKNNIHEIYKAHLNKMHTVARLQDQRFLSNKFFDFLMAEKPLILGKPKKINVNYLDYPVEDGYDIFFYRLLYNLDLERFQFIFYINENMHTSSEEYISDMSKNASLNKYDFLHVKDRKFMRFCMTPQTTEDIHQAFIDFFDRTYAFALGKLERSITTTSNDVLLEPVVRQ